ncbi:TPA: YcjF family protein [Streptococcus suis]
MNLLKGLVRKKVDIGLANDLIDKARTETEKMPPINILVAGKTGSGKSTLINALFREELAQTGVGLPVTQYIQQITKPGVPLTLFDTKGLELSSQAQAEVLKSLSDLIASQRLKGQDQAIHVAYYCLNATASRIEPFEIDMIKALSKEVPVILILTQAIGDQYKEFEQALEALDLPVRAIVPVLAKAYQVTAVQKIASHGLQKLIDLTLLVTPSQAHQAFINAQQIDIDRKVKQARSWAQKYIKTTFGVGFMPLPVADATVLVPMQITMLGHITAIFGVSLDKSQIVSLLAGLGGTGTATALGKYIVGNAFKLIPGLGTLAGGLISGATASALTMSLAYAYIEVLKHMVMNERLGHQLKLADLSKLMNQQFSDQLKLASQFLPDEAKAAIPEWLKGFFDVK